MTTSTSANSRSEDVRIFPIVISELKFRDLQRHIFGAHVVERAHHPALEDRSEALGCLSVDRTDDILPLGVVDDGMVHPWSLCGRTDNHPGSIARTANAICATASHRRPDCRSAGNRRPHASAGRSDKPDRASSSGNMRSN